MAVIILAFQHLQLDTHPAFILAQHLANNRPFAMHIHQILSHPIFSTIHHCIHVHVHVFTNLCSFIESLYVNACGTNYSDKNVVYVCQIFNVSHQGTMVLKIADTKPKKWVKGQIQKKFHVYVLGLFD